MKGEGSKPGPGSPAWKLLKARREVGLTQNECDEAAGFPNTRRANSYEAGRAIPPREYLEPLATLWKIPLEWFHDGEPSPVPRADEPLSEIPVYGPLPDGDVRQDRRGMRHARVAYPLTPGAHYRQYLGGDLEPYVKPGDFLLIIPNAKPKAVALVALGFPGSAYSDVYAMTRVGQDLQPAPVSEFQTLPEGDWTCIGAVGEVLRTMPSGLSVAFEFEGGLTLDQLRTPFG